MRDPSLRAHVPVGADDRRFAAPAGADGHSGSASFAGYARRSPFGIGKQALAALSAFPLVVTGTPTRRSRAAVFPLGRRSLPASRFV